MSAKSPALVLALAALAAAAAAAEIGFNERFALAPDRAQALAELVPGTEDYFYYHALQAQNTGRLAEVDPLLRQWSKQLGEGERYHLIERRQALLRYAREPQATLDFLRSRLNLVFNHAREQAEAAASHPAALDPAAISFDRFRQRAQAAHGDLGGFEETGLERLVGQPLEADERRDLLQRLPRPDVPGLETVVLAELREPGSRGFGHFPIHGRLTLAQLDALRAGLPALAGNSAFVDACARRLLPSPDTDWHADPAVRGAYLARLWAFAEGLPAAQNSFKACVLYRLLEHDRTQGVYDRARFIAYLQLPRAVPYAHPAWRERAAGRGEPAADLQREFRAATGLPPVGQDETLVRAFLERLLVDAEDASAFAEWVDARYLDGVLAETKLLHGVGDAAAWSGRLDPARLQALKDRVEIALDPANPEFLAPDAEVVLAATVKNVPRLTVKVFDLDAAAYYREHGREIDAAVDLDGLVANAERTVEYADAPVRRHVERFPFPELRAPGVYVVEFVGNGVSSRALVRKGRLRFSQRAGAAGHVFTVYDDAGHPAAGAALWLAGQTYRGGDDGRIDVPFATRAAGPASVVVQQGRLAALADFPHALEAYELRLGALLDREALLAGAQATVVLRPLLCINDRPADLALLQQATLEVTTRDVEGIAATQRREGLVFRDGEDLAHSFQVPPRTVSVLLRLTAKVRNESQNRDDEVSAEAALDVNGTLGGNGVADLLLRRVAGGHVLEARGRNGEPLAARVVNLSFKHRLCREQLHLTLQTDDAGRLTLGRLEDISVLWASGLGVSRTWRLGPQEGVLLSPVLHVRAGERIVLPAAGLDADGLRRDVSLLALTPNGGDEYAADALEHVAAADGRVAIAGLAPGDYRLTLKRSGDAVLLRVADAVRADGALVGAVRVLEATPARPLQVTGLGLEDGALVVRVAQAAPLARVHVLARRTMAGGDPWRGYVSGVPSHEPSRAVWLPLPASYVSGRSVGDEARYVLERRYAARLPGNMLARPSLILNPWSRTATETVVQALQEGEAWEDGNARQDLRRAGGYFGRSMTSGGRGGEESPSLDFLPAPARLWANLKPDAAGVVRLPLEELGGRGEVVAVAADELGMAWRSASFEESAWLPRDQRLAHALDASKPMTERQEAVGVPAGAAFTVPDLPAARVEVYDTLAKVFRLQQALQPDAEAARFAFLLDWPALAPERQRELYSEFACHELNFFLYHKDRPFFDRVVKPYLANKRDKTFMDHWLLGADLARYLAPTEFTRLNTLERILLGRRLPAQQPRLMRAVEDLHDLIPPDPEAFDRRFRAALRSGGLEGDNRAEARKEQAAAFDVAAAPAPTMAPPPAAAPRAPAPQEKAKAERRLAAKDRQAEGPELLAESADEEGGALAANAAAAFKRDAQARTRVRQLYRSPEVTREWVETHYHGVPLEETGPALVGVNGFWRDYARHDGRGPFLSPHLDETAGTTAERLCALAVLDLPFRAAPARDSLDGTRWTLVPGSPAVVYHQQIGVAGAGEGRTPLLAVENFFDPDDRWRQVGAERIEKTVREEFVAGRAYGAQVVLTNPTGARRRVSVLLQVPEGSLPLGGAAATRSLPLRLEPYSTQTLEYFFTFPAAGDFAHFPATVAEGDAVVGRAEALTCHVVARATQVDRASWAYLSQHGTPEEVLAFLREQNVHSPAVELPRIAWRLRDAAFFGQVLEALDARLAFDATLWSYAVFHNDAARIRAYLARAQPAFVQACGPWLQSPLVDADAEVLRLLEHREYWPLVNARAHAVGRRRSILNAAFAAQYGRLMDYLCCRPALDARERIAVCVCLLLQDRVEEARGWFAGVKPDDVETRLQADYLRAYLAFSQGRPGEARETAARYADYPVDRWRDRFRNVLAQADEATGGPAGVQDADRREEVQDRLAAEAPALALRVEGSRLELRSRNVAEAEVRYFPLDLELLFSRQPFLGDGEARLGTVRPARVERVKLGAGETMRGVDIPAALRQANLLVEAQAEGVVTRVSYTPHALDVQVIAAYGQLRVRATAGRKPVAGAYVKVYARLDDGEVRFYKDGYTDLRGAFDYASLSTDELDHAARFAVLVLDDKLGALIVEAEPPRR